MDARTAEPRVVVRETTQEQVCSNGWTGACSRFCFDLAPEGPAQWTYMGQGQGSYIQVSDVQYVGQGKGDLVRDRTNSVQLRPQCVGAMIFLVLLSFGLVMWATWNHLAGLRANADPWDCGLRDDDPLKRHSYGESWSKDRRAFCCERYGRACDRRLAVPNCTEMEWLSSKKECCQHGCCGNAEDWSEFDRAWCCKNLHRGCPRECQSSCSFQGEAKTCLEHLLQELFHQDGVLGACQSAYQKLQLECSACNACPKEVVCHETKPLF